MLFIDLICLDIEDIAPNLARVTLQTIVFDEGMLEYEDSCVGKKNPTNVVDVNINRIFVNI